MLRAGYIGYLLLSFLSVGSVHAQKVGVVLSGGGAKGLAHIGVLKALEENKIPIDYVTGTSMGGIVAGIYASGISPAEFEKIALSKSFLDWVYGRESKPYNRDIDYQNPSFVQLALLLDSSLTFLRNTTIASDWALNFALARYTAQPMSICRRDFNKLFVPLRIVGADVFTRHEVIFSSGALSDAMRVTQTVPFFYQPIKVRKKYLFDGGVYNNFPVDVMKDSFGPDITIGSDVASDIYQEYPYEEDERLISKTLPFALFLSNQSYSAKLGEKDVYIHPDLKGYNSLSFRRVKSLIDSGYAQTLRQIDDIKKKIPVRRSPEEVAKKREAFIRKAQPLIFDSVFFDGFKGGQEKYLRRFFAYRDSLLTLGQIRDRYYKLMAERYFRNLYPNILYDTARRRFRFQLTNRKQDNLRFDLGGAVATRNISYFFLRINHFYFRNFFLHSYINFYGGRFHTSLEARLRFQPPVIRAVYLEPQFTFNNWNYFKEKGLLVERLSPTILSTVDYKAGLAVSAFVAKQYSGSLYGFYVNSRDQYINGETLTSLDTLDDLRLSGMRFGMRLYNNTLNRKQYASKGRYFNVSADVFVLKETHIPGSTSMESLPQNHDRNWLRVRAVLQQYFTLTKRYSLGYHAEGVFSNQPLFSNYQGSVVNAPAFNPMQDSRSLLLRNFRSFNYVAAGVRNVISLQKKVDFRVAGYFFKPIQAIVRNADQRGSLDNDFARFFFAATTAVVFHSLIGPVALSANYYQDAYGDTENEFGVLFHVGLLLFNKSAME